MNLNLNPEETDIVLDVKIIETAKKQAILEEKEEELQRTEEWFNLRKGCWTASPTKKLMSCNAKGGRMGWYQNEKAFLFSPEVIKYIYGVAMERKTGVYLVTDSTKEMKYGTKIEPLIVKRVNEVIKEKGLYVEQVRYKQYSKFPNAGASSDGIVRYLESNEIFANYEQKACTSWNTHYDRTFELTDEKSMDFWQTQSQMIAWEVDKTFYAVVSPPKDINIYLRAENIDDLYEQWCEETELNIEIIDKSEIHSKALETRLNIAENTVQRWLEEGGNIKEIFYEEIDVVRALYYENLPQVKQSIEQKKEVNLTAEEPTEQLIETNDEIKNIEVSEEVIAVKKEIEVKEEDYDDLPF